MAKNNQSLSTSTKNRNNDNININTKSTVITYNKNNYKIDTHDINNNLKIHDAYNLNFDKTIKYAKAVNNNNNNNNNNDDNYCNNNNYDESKQSNKDDSNSDSSKEGKVSCLGRVTHASWLGGGDVEEIECDDDVEDEEGDEIDGDDDADDNSSSTETIVKEQTKWGWLVVIASMIIHVIADGISFSFGVLLNRLIDEFKVTKDKVALVGSLLGGIPLFMGPVCSVLINKLGCRIITVAGGIVTAVGFFISSFVKDFNYFYLTMSIISGLGLSLVYVPAVVIVAHYFDHKRSLATGLAVSGTGIGFSLFAPLIDIMLDKYSWSGTLRVLSACFLVISLCGLFFKPIQYKVEKKEKTQQELEKIRLKEIRRRRRERKRMRKAMLDDSRLPSRMSSVEKLERFIRHMEEAEAEEAAAAALTASFIDEIKEEKNIQIEHENKDDIHCDNKLKFRHKNKIYKSSENNNKNNNSTVELNKTSNTNINKAITKKRTKNNSECETEDENLISKENNTEKSNNNEEKSHLVRSFSIAALPSFYLDYDCDNGEKVQDYNSQNTFNKTENIHVEKNNGSLTDKNKIILNLIDHDNLINVLKHGRLAQNITKHDENSNIIPKRHTEALNLCSIENNNQIKNNLLDTSKSSNNEIILNITDNSNNIHYNKNYMAKDDTVDKSLIKNTTTNRSSSFINSIINNLVNFLSCRKPKPIKKQSDKDECPLKIKDTVYKLEERDQHQINKRDLLQAYNMPLCRKDIFYRGSLMNIRRMLINKSLALTNNKQFDNSSLIYNNGSIRNQSLTFSCPNLYVSPYDKSLSSSSSSFSSRSTLDTQNLNCFRRFSKRTLTSLKHLFSFSVLKNPTFLLFGFANFVFYMWHEIPMMFIRDYTDDCKCMSKEKVWILFIVCGLANTIGQWVYGYLGDRENINEKILYAISTIACGFTVVTIPLMLKHFGLMLTNQILFGIFLSANYVLNSIILVEILGVDKLTDAYGMLLLLQGFALVIGSPLAGWIGEISNYNNTFYYSGVFIILSGIMLLFMPLVEKMYNKHKAKKKRMRFQMRKTIETMKLNDNDNTIKQSHTKIILENSMSTINEIDEKQKNEEK